MWPSHRLLRVDVSGRATTHLVKSASTPASRLCDAPGVSHWFCRVRFTQLLHQLDNIQEKEKCGWMNVPWQVMRKMSSLEHWKPSLELRISKSKLSKLNFKLLSAFNTPTRFTSTVNLWGRTQFTAIITWRRHIRCFSATFPPFPVFPQCAFKMCRYQKLTWE